MGDNVNQNPFLGLFSTPEEATSITAENLPINVDESNEEERNCHTNKLNTPSNTERDNTEDQLIQDVYGLLLSSKTPQSRVFSQLVAVESETIEDAVFERLTLPFIEDILVENPSFDKQNDVKSHTLLAIPYLFECFCRLNKYQNHEKLRETVDYLKRLTLRSTATALQPDILENQKVHEQYISLFQTCDSLSNIENFTEELVKTIKSENPDDFEQLLESSFSPPLKIVHEDITSCKSALAYSKWWYDVLLVYSNIEPLAMILHNYTAPDLQFKPDAYTKSLLGSLLSISCQPEIFQDTFQNFHNRFHQSTQAEVVYVWLALKGQNESLHKVFHSLFKCSPEVRHLTLRWIGQCLDLNSIRGMMMNPQHYFQQNEMQVLPVSDGFMMNLCNVLLRLCQPFCANYEKVPKIDPTYYAAKPKDREESRKRGLHMFTMPGKTCLLPVPEGESRPVAETFNFITECFYLTHRALNLGFQVVLDKLIKSIQDIGRLQSSPDSNRFKEIIEVEMAKYMCYRTTLLDPELLNLLAKFHATTAFWLMQVILNPVGPDDYNKASYCPEQVKTVTFPLPEPVPHTLRCIPEFIVENTNGYIRFLKLQNQNTFEEQGSFFLQNILTELIALMESPKRIFNPHLRAQLAEGLEALLPLTDSDAVNHAPLGTFHREQLFVTHPHRDFIVPSLLSVFVSIEMTGQSVQFEQKFNYRLPMYTVMKYLWKIEEHRSVFRKLAQEAEGNMEAVQPPLFLQFINLLMNDAVYLLDEALTNMAQLKTMLEAKENGDWDSLSNDERVEQLRHLRRVGMIAKFDNILGRETISAFKMMTTEIKSSFCHPTMVDRIASMLNYLLLQLVGPNQRNLKVKDQKEYEFNPAQLVLSLCEIYINLGQNKNFILAISQDGRSYRSNLFELADNVLVRIGGISILGDFDNLAKQVTVAANWKKEEDEILADVPDDFLDPIMSTLMSDPVKLPSSKVSVDRQTIARHLLSDQTDPFNRSPLTMDMVKSDVELRTRIEEWIKSRKESCSSKNND